MRTSSDYSSERLFIDLSSSYVCAWPDVYDTLRTPQDRVDGYDGR
jgi:hypothetical protein